MVLYHGSTNIIHFPFYGGGKEHNDYGRAFYCTEDIEMAKEWSCTDSKGGFVNTYQIDINELAILDLSDKQYTVLNWLAILLKNRNFSLSSDISKKGYKYIIDNFSINHEEYDVIKGYRADDSYFSFANAFLNNGISLEQLSKALYLGKLGYQVAIRSELAFKELAFIDAEKVNGEKYFLKRSLRDRKARDDFALIKKQTDLNGRYLIDIMRGN